MSSHPRPSPNHLPAEMLILVGKIAIQSAYLDLLLGELLSGLSDIPSDDRAKSIYILDTRRKTQDAEKIIKSKFSEPELETLLSLVQRAGDLLADRNLTLHAVIGYRTTDLSEPIYIPFRGKYSGKETPFTKETLDPIFNELDALCRELLEECAKRGYTAFEPLT